MDPYIQLPAVPVLEGRQDFIIERCRGKCVLHLGCVDTGLLHERSQRGELMHQKLAAVAHELWGLDINAEGIAFLQERGFNNLIVGDVCALEEIETLQGKQFDVIVASEVIEHLQNPGLFLQGVKSVMSSEKTLLIVTVPNAFRIDTLRGLLRGVEHVHPDHNYWFSYHTITNLLQKNGLNVAEVYVYAFPSNRFSLNRARKGLNSDEVKTINGQSSASAGLLSLVRRILGVLSYLKLVPKWLLVAWLFRKTPFFADGLIVVCTTQQS